MDKIKKYAEIFAIALITISCWFGPVNEKPEKYAFIFSYTIGNESGVIAGNTDNLNESMQILKERNNDKKLLIRDWNIAQVYQKPASNTGKTFMVCGLLIYLVLVFLRIYDDKKERKK